MTVIRRPGSSSSAQGPALYTIITIFVLLIIYVLTVTDDVPVDDGATINKAIDINTANKGSSSSLRHRVVEKRQQLQSALKSLTANHIPSRLARLRENSEVVGERLGEIRAGTETVEEVLHGQGSGGNTGGSSTGDGAGDTKVKGGGRSDKPPMQLDEIIDYLSTWIHTLHETLVAAKHESYFGIWEAYHDLTVKTLYLWDREYLARMPERRDDGTIFLSLATYRDENCLNTVKGAFGKAKDPEKLYVGIVQQNCHANCKSGILVGGGTEDVPPDDDCKKLFCESDEGKDLCAKGHVRSLDIDEPESLGPYAARYFASKLWYGENWFMQTDAHMTFLQDWDAISVDMLKKAPSKKPVLSHYPPSERANLANLADKPASRLCGPVFATSDLENQIIRLEGASEYDRVQVASPRFAPFTAAGYFVAHADFLREVPFDPFLPWIFMGEEIIMSARLWTAGYDIFSPVQSVVGHIYVRRHKPKFWESVHRAFSPGVHNPLQALVLNRVKYQLGYPEATKDMLKPKNLLTAVEQYGMGTARPLETYMKLVGLNMDKKEVTYTGWCEKGTPPPGFEEFNHLYHQ